MKIGIIKEGKNPPDERVPLSPEQCAHIAKEYPQLELRVQSSLVRRYKDREYADLGIQVVDDVSDCEVILGVKEVPIDMLMENKTFFFFSHTIKEQPYNRNLLRAILEKNIRLIDWECLVNQDGKRIIGFGRYAGLVGAYNTFRAWGLKYRAFDLKPAYLCEDFQEVVAELQQVKLSNIKIAITGRGRVASGIIEILDLLQIHAVHYLDFLERDFDHPVYTQLAVTQYARRKDGSERKAQDYYQHPELFESDFMRFAKKADIYISGHYWDANAPFIITRQELKSPDINLKVVGDISCDIDGPVATTIRPSTIKDPIYGYNPQTEAEADFMNQENIAVMAVDNLPCELPKDASTDFGKEIIEHLIPALISNDSKQILQNSTLTQAGKLTEKFAYLQSYVDGK